MRALSLLLAPLAACSITFGDAPPSTPAKPCTNSYALPVVDGLFGTGSFIAAGLVMHQAVTNSRSSLGAVFVAPPLAAAGLAYWVSALIGRSRVRRCLNP